MDQIRFEMKILKRMMIDSSWIVWFRYYFHKYLYFFFFNFVFCTPINDFTRMLFSLRPISAQKGTTKIKLSLNFTQRFFFFIEMHSFHLVSFFLLGSLQISNNARLVKSSFYLGQISITFHIASSIVGADFYFICYVFGLRNLMPLSKLKRSKKREKKYKWNELVHIR